MDTGHKAFCVFLSESGRVRVCVREKVKNDLKEGAFVTQRLFVGGPRVDCVAIIFNKERRQTSTASSQHAEISTVAPYFYSQTHEHNVLFVQMHDRKTGVKIVNLLLYKKVKCLFIVCFFLIILEAIQLDKHHIYTMLSFLRHHISANSNSSKTKPSEETSETKLRFALKTLRNSFNFRECSL